MNDGLEEKRQTIIEYRNDLKNILNQQSKKKSKSNLEQSKKILGESK